jgi:hypothetical protein
MPCPPDAIDVLQEKSWVGTLSVGQADERGIVPGEEGTLPPAQVLIMLHDLPAPGVAQTGVA